MIYILEGLINQWRMVMDKIFNSFSMLILFVSVLLFAMMINAGDTGKTITRDTHASYFYMVDTVDVDKDGIEETEIEYYQNEKTTVICFYLLGQDTAYGLGIDFLTDGVINFMITDMDLDGSMDSESVAWYGVKLPEILNEEDIFNMLDNIFNFEYQRIEEQQRV